MRLPLEVFMVLFVTSSHDLSCRIQCYRPSSTQLEASKSPKHIVNNSVYTEREEEAWQISFFCFNPSAHKDIVEKFECKPEYTKLKLVFKQGRNITSTYLELGPSLVAFNRFIGLNLEGFRLKTLPGKCEIWIEAISTIKTFGILIMLCIISIF